MIRRREPFPFVVSLGRSFSPVQNLLHFLGMNIECDVRIEYLANSASHHRWREGLGLTISKDGSFTPLFILNLFFR